MTSITDALGKVTTFDYSGSDLVGITDPLGNVTTISYLTGDKVDTITDATGSGTIKFTYNSGNTVVTDQNGHGATYAYNTQNLQVSSTTDALGHAASQQYDSNYNVSQYSDALSDLSKFNFSTDGRNNLQSVQDGTGASITFGYPSSGNNLYYPLNQTDAQGNKTDYQYDTNGNLLSATDHASSSGLTYTYNTNGTIATEKDANNNTTSFSYDSQGNLIKVTPPSPLGATTLAVDAQTSRVNSVTDGKQQKTSYSYDTLDRLTKVQSPNQRDVANPWKFAGGYYDSSTGLYKFGTRYYDTGLARWTQREGLSHF